MPGEGPKTEEEKNDEAETGPQDDAGMESEEMLQSEDTRKTPLLPPDDGGPPSTVEVHIGNSVRQIGGVMIYDGVPEGYDAAPPSQVEIIPESKPAKDEDDTTGDEPPADSPGLYSTYDYEASLTDPGNEESTSPLSCRPLTTDRPPNMSDIQGAIRYLREKRDKDK